MAHGMKEKDLEEHIERYLVNEPIAVYGHSGNDYAPKLMEYRSVGSSEYDKELCIIPSELIAFLKDTQREEFDKAVNTFSGDERKAESKIIETVVKILKDGALGLFHKKDIGCSGGRFTMIYFKPANDKTHEHEHCYNLNRLAVVRQLKYSNKNNNAIDIVLFVNGIPVVTMELKNALTGQYHHHAIKQYIQDRPTAGETLLEFKRCLVHFAVGTEQVFMTTHLQGNRTRFLPFNTGLSNVSDRRKGYATSYMWEDILRKDSLIDLIQNYIVVQIDVKKQYDDKRKRFKETKEETLIFPRYHQRRAVMKLVDDVRCEGVGRRYLIQHSAGSGKSNTIVWLAFNLSGFYRNYTDSKSLFDSVIVVTDRRVLNNQLKKSIKQYDLTSGEVEYIDETRTSVVLQKAIEENKRVIVTTLQRFPLISENIARFTDRNYAVIIDEAHSSQSGKAARQMRKTLSLSEAEELDKVETSIDDIIDDEIAKMGVRDNISFFAFTATPKNKTIELFCERIHGTKEPFDSYSMEEAIKEGFILDVMQNYMSFKRYYKIATRKGVEDKEYEKKRTVKLLNSYVDLQDGAIERKSRIMIEHFATQTAKEIEGEARAMLVTRSRLHAVRYKRKFDDIMREMRLPYKALVAFSGSVTDDETGETYTETSMNNLGGHISITDALKMPQYRILIAANKYQTGFDEPLLHTMFVDKKLGGTSTVQTLSRLNRTRRGKTSTMILDFVNDPDMILEDFQRFYGKNFIIEENETDPNSLYDVERKIYSFDVFTNKEVNEFAELFFRDGNNKEEVNSILDRVVLVYVDSLDDDQKSMFKQDAKAFIRLYSFLSQIITFRDVKLEKLYVFLIGLCKKLPYAMSNINTDVVGEVELDSYKLHYQYTKSLDLKSGNAEEKGLSPADSHPMPGEELDFLTNIIKTLNDTFGLELTDDDKVEFFKMRDKIYSNGELMKFFNVDNTKDNIQDKFNEEIDNELLSFIESKLDLYNKLSEDRTNTMFKRLWFNEMYDRMVRRMNFK